MPCICYVPKKFHASSLMIIADANRIIHDYLRQGFKLTLRQLYYQFIARDLLPESWIDPDIQPQAGVADGYEEHDEELQAARRPHQRWPPGWKD